MFTAARRPMSNGFDLEPDMAGRDETLTLNGCIGSITADDAET